MAAKLWLYKGEMLPMKQLEKISPVSDSVIRERIHKGWPVERAVDTPSMQHAQTFSRYLDGLREDAPPEGLSPAESDRYGTAIKIFRKVMTGAPSEFGFRCTNPGTRYEFDTDNLRFRVEFSEHGSLARLTAFWPGNGISSSLMRTYAIDKGIPKEVTA